MKFKSLLLMSAVLLFAGNASATVIDCTDFGVEDPKDSTNTIGVGSGGKFASSSITTAGTTVGATVDNSNCGPWPGNDSGSGGSDLTALTGGYGSDLFSLTGVSGDWLLLDKAENPDEGEGLQDGAISVTFDPLSGTPWDNASSGTFSISSNVAYVDYLIVLKFDGVYSSFLSDSLADGWGWDTDTDGDGGFGLSHISVYVRETVPEPGMVSLLAIGILGMVVARRRMKL